MRGLQTRKIGAAGNKLLWLRSIPSTKPDIQRSRSPIHAQNHSIGWTFHTAWVNKRLMHRSKQHLYSIISQPLAFRGRVLSRQRMSSGHLTLRAKKGISSALTLEMNRCSYPDPALRIRGGDPCGGKQANSPLPRQAASIAFFADFRSRRIKHALSDQPSIMLDVCVCGQSAPSYML